VEVEIYNLEKTRSKKVRALVDAGASLSVIPKSLADELGIEAVSEDKVMTGAGQIRISRGRAWIKLEGKESPFDLWISDIIDKVLIGVVVLETFGFEVDPTTGTLREKLLLLYCTRDS